MRPRSGEVVTVLGYGIAAQEATVEANDGARILLRLNEQDGLAVGTTLELQYVRYESMYSASGALESRTGNLWWLVVTAVDRVQRRAFVRVPVQDKATLLLANKAGGEDAFLVDLSDISAGGCKFEHSTSIAEGKRAELRFRVLEGRIHLSAVVLECRAAQRGRYTIRARFDEISEADRERVIAWVIAQTRQGN